MKHMSKAVSVFLALALLLALLPAAALAEASANTVIEIKSADDLKKIGQDASYPLNGSYRLTANIDLGGSSNPWTPIGSSYSNSFTGVFDGEGHAISGLYVYVNGNDTYAGLFGWIGDYGNTGAIVKNLRVSGSVATESSSGARAGGIAGTCFYGTVQNCAFSGPVSAAGRGYAVMAGGVVGSNYGTVSGCEHRDDEISATSVNANSNAGGVVGYNSVGKVENCANIEGAVTATKDGGDYASAGGVVGGNANNGTVSYCFSAGGPVTADNKDNTGSGSAGGVVGRVDENANAPTSCYYLAAETSGQALSAAEFKDQSKFVDWDFTKVWIMGEDRPMLRAFLTEVSTWTGLQAALQQNGAVRLTADVTHNGSTDLALLVPSGKTVTLDLNGHTIDRALTSLTVDGYVICVDSTGDLTVTDSSATAENPVGSGVITGGYNYDGGGVYVYQGRFTMTGGAVSGNTAHTNGGGVYVYQGRFTMTGGSITGNTAGAYGGGVSLKAGGDHTMTGGSITGNTAQNHGGVNVDVCCLHVSGSPVVENNTAGTGNDKAASNVNIYNSTRAFVIDGALDAAARIGVTMRMPGVFTEGLGLGTETAKGALTNFFSDNGAYYVAKTTGGEAILRNVYTITLDANGGKFAGGAATKAQTAYEGDYLYTVAADAEKPVRSGHSFRSWTLDKAGETPLDDAYTLSGDTTLYAQWTENAAPAPVDYDPAPAAPKETRFDEVDVTKGGSLENFKQVGTYTPGMFADAGEDDWYMENLKAAVELGILEGLGDGTFGVGQPLKLSETLAIACRLHNLYYGGSGKFDQTKDADWYAVYADYAAKYGFAAKGQYDLTKPATRAQFAAILAAALPDAALAPINAVTVLPDMAPDDPRLPAVLKLYNAGILTGVDAAGSFAPDAVIPREQVAAMATRVADPALRKAFTL